MFGGMTGVEAPSRTAPFHEHSTFPRFFLSATTSSNWGASGKAHPGRRTRHFFPRRSALAAFRVKAYAFTPASLQ